MSGMSGTYTTFRPPHLASEYLGVPGHEASGALLPWSVLDALGAARGGPCEYVVVGETRYPDGRRFLDFAVNRGWVEEHSNYREMDGRLRYQCPDCALVGGKHGRSCPLG